MMTQSGTSGQDSDSAPFRRNSRLTRLFTSFASTVSHAAGNPITFVVCCLAIILWMASGPVFGFSDTWQLVINTGTTIVTFLMVFLIQNTQNRDNAALQAKMDEVIRAVSDANNHFIGIEHLTAEELEEIRKAVEDDAQEDGNGHQQELRTRKIDQTFARLSRVSGLRR